MRLIASVVTKIARPGKGRDPPRVEHVDAALAQHVAPGRGRGLDAQTEERQERLQDDHARHLERRDDDDRRHQVREDLAEDDTQVPKPEGAARRDEVPLADGPGLGAHHARVERPVRDAEHDDHVDEARPEDDDHRQGEEDERERQHDVDDGHDDRVGAPGHVSGAEPQQHADARRDQDRGDAHHERDPPPVDDPREQVAAHLVGAEDVVARCRRPSRRAAPGDGGCRPRGGPSARPRGRGRRRRRSAAGGRSPPGPT